MVKKQTILLDYIIKLTLLQNYKQTTIVNSIDKSQSIVGSFSSALI